MFKSILTKTLWERRRSISFWSLGLFLYVLAICWMFPSIEGVEEFAAFTEEMPEAFRALVGELEDFTTATGFLGGEIYGLALPLVMSILAIGFGASVISREEESGTLELLLSSPMSRSVILRQKAAALVVNLAIVGTAAWLAVTIATIGVDLDIDLVKAAWATLSAVLLALCFGFIALMVTSLGGKRGIAIGVASVLFIVSYFANTLAILISEIEPLQSFSLLYYYEGAAILRDGPQLLNFLLLIGFIIAIYIVGELKFKRRDTGV